MNYLKYTQYVYLVFAIYFIYEGISKMISNDEESPIFYFVIGGLAVFMFFFRRKFAKKFEDARKESTK